MLSRLILLFVAVPLLELALLLQVGQWIGLGPTVALVVATGFAGAAFSAFKARLTELAVAELAPIGAEMRRLAADPAQIDAILRAGAERARALARPVLAEAKAAVGFVAP